jgi:peptidoglycan/xylan/chitin deacetylase (PgdA/CDA1 family)
VRSDDDLLQFLIRYRMPVTIFATKKWLDANPRGQLRDMASLA